MAQTATLLQAEGQVSSAAGPLAAGSSLEFGTRVLTGADGFAVVRIEWQTPAGRCQRDNAFGYGQPFVVSRPAAACVPGVITDVVSTLTRLDVGKPDDPKRDDRGFAATVDAVGAAEFEALRQGMRPLARGQSRAAPDFKRIHASSAGACSLACAADSQCVAMTFSTDDHSCRLKTAIGSPQNAPRAISAIKRSAVKGPMLKTP
jgi:hypothetical protein